MCCTVVALDASVHDTLAYHSHVLPPAIDAFVAALALHGLALLLAIWLTTS